MKPNRRLACIIIPSFSLQALRRAEPALQGLPVAIEGGAIELGAVGAGAIEGGASDRQRRGREGRRSPPRLIECSEECRALGIVEGMTAVQARAIFPCLTIRPLDEALLERAQGTLLELLHDISPVVESGGPGLFFIDTRGLIHHATREEAFLVKLQNRVAHLGYVARIGLAGTRFTALATAACHEGISRVAPGQERAHLAALPLAALPMSEALAERLAALGLRTMGDFAALPPASVEVRYGAEGVALHRLARGIDPTPLRYRFPEAQNRVHVDLEQEAGDIERLRAHLRPALEEALGRTVSRGGAVTAVQIELGLAGAESMSFTIRPARPTVNPATLERLFLLELRDLSLPGPTVSLTVTVTGEIRSPGEEQSLFAVSRTTARKLDLALSHLRKLYGKEAVGHAAVQEATRPEERFHLVQLERLDPSGREPHHRPPERRVSAPHPPVLRLVHPPRPITASFAEGRLSAFTFEGGSHRVLSVIGPERREGGWWDRPFARDYYQVMLMGSGLFWIFHDRLDGGWYVHGIFD
ncbi:MAG: DNA polymerase Y family protein [Planctomycetota bacterium]